MAFCIPTLPRLFCRPSRYKCALPSSSTTRRLVVSCGGASESLRDEAVVEVECVRLAHLGQGVCFEPGRDRVTFVHGALPGETLTASLYKVSCTPCSLMGAFLCCRS